MRLKAATEIPHFSFLISHFYLCPGGITMRYIYADNAATARMIDTAVKSMPPFLQ